MSEEEAAGVMLITGAARRIGAALTRHFAARGWRIALHCHHAEAEAATLAQSLTRDGKHVCVLPADLAEPGAPRRLLDATIKRLGPPRCLINNAARFLRDTPLSASEESWEGNMAVNLRAPFFLCQRFAANLPKEREGVVVNITDQRVWNPTPYFTTYTLSKAGLATLTRTLALSLAPRIRVNAVAPGPVLPDSRQSDEQFKRQCRAMPLQRGGSLKDLCAAVEFLIQSRSVTGQTIAVDGGQHLGWAHRPRPTASPPDHN